MTGNSDRSNGYEAVASQFAERRRTAAIGLETIRHWAAQLPYGAAVLDLGCGCGEPNAKELVRLGFAVFGVDASPSLMAQFHDGNPQASWACAAVEDATFFDRKFAAVLAIGLLFLLAEDTQRALVGKVGRCLEAGGSFLFTAPQQACEWTDVLTGRRSVSLGAVEYEAALGWAGLTMSGSYVDEGQNFYFVASKLA